MNDEEYFEKIADDFTEHYEKSFNLKKTNKKIKKKEKNKK